jgi:predicted nucleotidyltransferase
MTVRIQREDIIGGLPAFEIRRFFRHVKGWHSRDFTKNWMMEGLGLSDRKATQVIRSLIVEGYVVRSGKRDGEAAYEFTERGSSLVRASGAKRIARSTAEGALQAFMARVKKINEDPSFFYTVTSVAVFGSYLRDVGELGDLDLAVRLKSRIADNDQRVTRELEHACSSGRTFSRFIDQLTWAQDEVMLALKARKRTISIQPWYSFVGMVKDNNFRYEVLLGDPESIREELKTTDENLKPRSQRSSPDPAWPKK